MGPLLIQFELNLARIYVLNPKTQQDIFNKSLLWIKEHLEWMQLLIAHVNAHIQALKKSKENLKNVLLQRNFKHLVEKMDEY